MPWFAFLIILAVMLIAPHLEAGLAWAAASIMIISAIVVGLSE